MRVNFNEVFDTNDGSITPRTVVKIGGVQMGPGVSFGGGVSMGGVNLAEYVGKDLEVIQHGDGVVEIQKIYN